MSSHDDRLGQPEPRRPASKDVDDAYHEYLWGAESPRAFARRMKVAGAKERNSKAMSVEVGVEAALAGIASR